MVERKINSIIIILIILAIVGICGCITIKEVDYDQYLKDSSFYRPSITPTPTALTPNDQDGEPSFEIQPNGNGKTLEEAIGELETLDAEGFLNLENMTIYQVLGTGVGIGGRANSWILAAKQDERNITYSFDLSGGGETTWPGPLSGEEINLEDIISPADLFNKNRATIIESYRNAEVSYSDLFLKDDIYTIAIRNRTKIIELKFKADTGELI